MKSLTCIEGDRLTVAQIAEAMGVSGRAIRKRSDAEGWAFEKASGRGGGKAFAVAALPEDVQCKVLLAYPPAVVDEPDAAPVSPVFTYSSESQWASFDRKPETQKSIGRRRANILFSVMALVDGGTPLNMAFALVAEREDESPRTLENWYHGKPGKPGAKHYARADWVAALAPAYVGRTTKAECSPEAWEYFKAEYLRLERPSAAACYHRLQRAAAIHNWTIPSLKTLERRIVREIPLAVRVRMREGEMALQALYPAQQRTVRDLHAMQWINGDGYQHNVFVKWPDGSIARPKTWFWQDVYSRKIIGWRTDLTEHTDVIRLSFGDVVERYGIPDHITIDNTRAAANKWMTGGIKYRNRYKVQDEEVLGLFPQLGIDVHWTSLDKTAGGKNVGHGQAKPIERAFGQGGLGDYVDKRLEFEGAWCGNDPTSKPENYGAKAVPLADFIAVLADSLTAWNAMKGRRTEMCAGVLSFDEAFAKSYETALVRKPTEEQRRMWLLPAEARRVQRDGSITLDAGSAPGAPRNRYWSESLVAHCGQKIVVRFDPDDLHQAVECYSLDGRYIGQGDCVQATGYGDTQAGREHTRARTQWKKAVREQAKAENKLDALSAARLLPKTEQPPEPETKVARMFHAPVKSNRAEAVAVIEEDDEELERNFRNNILRMARENDD